MMLLRFEQLRIIRIDLRLSYCNKPTKTFQVSFVENHKDPSCRTIEKVTLGFQYHSGLMLEFEYHNGMD